MTDSPAHNAMGPICRVGGAVCGLILLVFGVVGFLSGVPFTSQSGVKVLFLHTNGLLCLVSVVFGLLLIGAAVVGGKISAAVNTAVAVLLLLSGLGNLAVMETGLNIFAFRMGNVIFSFVIGIVLLTCGLYGRVPTGDPAQHGAVV